MTWAQQWEVPVDYDRPVVFECGASIALAGVDNGAGSVESLTLYGKTGGVNAVKTGDDLGLQNIRDGIGTDDGALIVAYSTSSTESDPYLTFNVHCRKVTESGLVIGDGVLVGTYQTYSGVGDFAEDLWTGSDGVTNIDGLTKGDWRFYTDAGGNIHLTLIGLHVAEDADDRYVCVLDIPFSSSGGMGTAVLTTSPNPPADSTVNGDLIVIPWDFPVGIRVDGSGLEIVTQKSSRYTVASGTIAGVDGSAAPIDPPSGDTPSPFVASVSNVGTARAFTFVGIG
jgi:hypothetical protein